jgi:hypothetical protein
MALALVGVLLVLGLAYGARTSNQLAHATRTTWSLQAQYLAEGGVQFARRNLDTLRLPYQRALNFETGQVTLSVTGSVFTGRTIRATAVAGRVTRWLVVTVDGWGRVVERSGAIQ